MIEEGSEVIEEDMDEEVRAAADSSGKNSRLRYARNYVNLLREEEAASVEEILNEEKEADTRLKFSVPGNQFRGQHQRGGRCK